MLKKMWKIQVEQGDFRFYRCSKKSSNLQFNGKVSDFPDVWKMQKMKVKLHNYRYYKCSNKCGNWRQSGKILHFIDVEKNLGI